ncbi:MAG: hypothetical protein K8I29_12105 [Alphaproteobacteria bacterium]|uniref:Uncharacterized protein n=1 Tax=Candidatus Nitrobium versatile TaxID=2884831 RepID=A0A953JBJ5_9BACT|nr:hypothetical protein [Candidatus Nitrobium versatile]
MGKQGSGNRIIIYIDYQKERFFIRRNGSTEDPSPELLSSGQVESVAVLTDSSLFSKKREEGYRYYAKGAKYHFHEKPLDVPSLNKPRSLFQSLKLRENTIVGLLFSNRLLFFAYHRGEVVWRFTDVDSTEESEIEGRINELNLPGHYKREIYGYTLPFERLSEAIQATPVYRDLEQEARRSRRLQIALSIGAVALSLLVWGFLFLKESRAKTKVEELAREKSNIMREIKRELQLRLPLYLDHLNVPFDAVLKELAFLEGRRFALINVTVEKDEIAGRVTLSDPKEAFKIKEASRATLSLKGGNIEVNFTRPLKKAAALPGSRSVRGLFTLK